MKPITLHPVSVLAGIALALLVALATAAQTITNEQPIVGFVPQDRIVGYVPAEQWTYIKIQDFGGAPSFTVPGDRYLVVTRKAGSSFTNLTVNGVQSQARFAAVPTGLEVSNSRVVLQPGDVLGGVAKTPYFFEFWGYLEPL